MLQEIKQRWVVTLLLVVACKLRWVNGEPQMPCFFIFGDSLSDSGNNNNLPTEAKVNNPPYGVDYPQGPTGRFTNGKNTVDVLAEKLGFDHHIPPFATASGDIMLQGVNYASGSAGIRDETGRHLGENIPMNIQLQHHQLTIGRMVGIIGNNETTENRLKQCLYYVGVGSNDYLNNYYLPERYATNKAFTPQAYAKSLITQYSEQLKALYNTGARKFALPGLGNIGCIPQAIRLYSTNASHCAEHLNLAINHFNSELVSLVDQFNKDLTDAKFVFVNNTGMVIQDPIGIGFRYFTSGCCEVREDGQCVPNTTPCAKRSEYLFWDSFHPTEAINVITATRTYIAEIPSDAYPIDVRSLALLQLPNTKPV